MGQFPAGAWAVGLLLYFFVFFVVCNYSILAASDLGLDTEVEFDDPGFQAAAVNDTLAEEAAAADTGSISNFWDALKFMTGIGASDVSIGIPGAYQYIFSFLFFWIPAIMLIWSGWMALPFFH